MEPMTLGSPTGSPSANSTYLPAFLMGEPQDPKTSRNTLSPNIGGRHAFATSTAANTPQDYVRATLEQRTLFGNPQTPNRNNTGVESEVQNASTAGPPILGLFDSMREELTQLPTPNRPIYYGTTVRSPNKGVYEMNHGYDQTSLQNQSFYNDSFLNHNSFNASRGIVSPLASQQLRNTDFWVTVFGFPLTAKIVILNHFAACGTIIEHIFPPQNGNWVHIRYSSRMECDKAITFNGKVLCNNIMIGVINCKDKLIVDRENLSNNNVHMTNVRSLTQIGYKSVKNESTMDVLNVSSNTPQQSTGIINKAMGMIFGW